MSRFAAILCAAGLLAGCASDPLGNVPRLSQTDVSETDIRAAIGAQPEDASEPLVSQSSATTALPEQADQPRRGLLGFLRRAADNARSSDTSETDEIAALPDAPEATAPATSGGIFGRSSAPAPNDPDFQIVELGTQLPYGTLARVCNVRSAQLGTRVDRYPENRGTYALYDSQPGNTAPHTFYVTGFKDRCARQFTAALAVFGSAETHEQLRYGLPAKVQPYSETDAAYERLKSRICRVSRGKPCGSALPRLSRDTVFVSVYEQFGSNPIWKTILIHDGEVVETDIRGN
ncbi:hypothetical protein ACG74X_11180 [Marivita sp. S0852]|uniref:hypothetical protein n=1 Tax=Marivita sp. S0852 TaxID=3373893 RepID=UPI003981B0B5